MAKSYLFMKPLALPLPADELTEASVAPISLMEAQNCLKQDMPLLVWTSTTEASGNIDQGWVEFTHTGEGSSRSLSLRCSLRSDCSDLVQGLCDRFGWVAFDEAPTFFQPFRSPSPC